MNLTELLNNAIDNRLSGVHTCLPGRIESYNPATGKASVKPLLKKRYTDDSEQALPVIVGVPVVFPRAGSASLTFPLANGDGVLLVFAERSLDKWLSEGGEVAPDDPRRFDLSDAIAIPGLCPFSDGSPDEDGSKLVLQFGGGKLAIDSTGKVALGNTAEELIDLINDFFTAISTSTCAAPGSPLVTAPPTAFADIIARLAAIKGTL